MANFFDQFDAAAPAPARNFFDQFDAPAAPAPATASAASAAPAADVPGQVSIGGFKPSLIGMAKGIWSGLTLPADVYQGKVDPLSEEGIGRAANLAGTVSLGGTGAMPGPLGTGMVRPAIEATAAARTTPQELLGAGAQGFKEARASQVAIDPKDVTDLLTRTRTKLADEGKPRSVAPGVNNTLNELEASIERARTAGQPLSANDLVAYRQTLTSHGKTPTPDAAAAGIAKSQFDEWLGQTAPTLAPVLQDAVANYRIGSLGQDITNKANRATYGAAAANSGMNIENKLRQSLVGIVSDRRKLGRYSPEVQQMMKQVVEGTLPANALRKAGNLLGGGGGALAAIYGLSALGTHPGAALAPVVGYGIKRLGNRLTLNKLDRIAQEAMSSAPLVQNRLANAPPPALAPAGGLLGMLTRNPQLLVPLLRGDPRDQ